MSSWWARAATSAELLELRPELARLVRELRADAEARVPGRLHDLLERRVHQLLGVDVTAPAPTDPTKAEQAALAVAEQFVLDVHSLTDADVARLAAHFTPAEQLAILIDVALLDGFARFARLAGAVPPSSAATTSHSEDP